MLRVVIERALTGDLWEDFLSRISLEDEGVAPGLELELYLGERAELRSPSGEAPFKKPFYLDFTADSLLWRVAHSGRHSEASARAVLGKDELPRVFDATAGLGRDSFILQCCGARVLMFERNPTVWALLCDALERARGNEEFMRGLPHGLPELAPLGSVLEHPERGNAEIIYYDPMFPPRRKSAQVKKEMQILHAVVGADHDSDDILPELVRRASKRVVVKRPADAPCVAAGELKRSGFADGKACRFDIYPGAGA